MGTCGENVVSSLGRQQPPMGYALSIVWGLVPLQYSWEGLEENDQLFRLPMARRPDSSPREIKLGRPLSSFGLEVVSRF